MRSTKVEILALLKRNGGYSVAHLANSLALSSVTIRQHLTHLERDGLVLTQKVADERGRPHYVFRLTSKAHAAAFPRRTDRLVEFVLREVADLSPSELEGMDRQDKVSLVLQRVAERLASEYAPLLERWPLQERVAFVTEVMHADGGLAEWEQVADGFAIRDYNCLFHRLLSDEDPTAPCEWHRTFLAVTLGVNVETRRCADEAGHCCSFLVRERPQENGL
jgi:predicted ArsR family transcriptional regulator